MPSNGSLVLGDVNINVSASDSVGITKLELYRNGTLYATTPSAYSFYWDTRTVTNGNYTFYAKAYDAAGNVGSTQIQVVK